MGESHQLARDRDETEGEKDQEEVEGLQDLEGQDQGLQHAPTPLWLYGQDGQKEELGRCQQLLAEGNTDGSVAMVTNALPCMRLVRYRHIERRRLGQRVSRRLVKRARARGKLKMKEKGK